MLPTFEEKKAEVAKLFHNNDFHLGFRKMMDCVLDTADLENYRQTLELNEWMEEEKPDDSEKISRCTTFLDSLKMAIPTLTSQEEPTLLLDAQEIAKNYGGRGFQLGPVNVKIHNGDIWGLVGENGNGKTTLLRILAKDLGHDSGTIQYELGSAYSDDYELRTHLVYLPQRTPKWYGSLKENLKFAATQYGTTGEENELLVQMYILRFGLWNFRFHQWSELSSGYKMRYELARTFLRKPRILLLDEPLANLDVLAQQLVLEDLQNLSKSLSNPIGIVLSSQQLFEVEKISNKVIFLKLGKPTHLSDVNDVEGVKMTVLEMDLNIDKNTLQAYLADMPVQSIQYNGGMFVITIAQEKAMDATLQLLISKGVSIQYFRDITQSSRRLFM